MIFISIGGGAGKCITWAVIMMILHLDLRHSGYLSLRITYCTYEELEILENVCSIQCECGAEWNRKKNVNKIFLKRILRRPWSATSAKCECDPGSGSVLSNFFLEFNSPRLWYISSFFFLSFWRVPSFPFPTTLTIPSTLDSAPNVGAQHNAQRLPVLSFFNSTAFDVINHIIGAFVRLGAYVAQTRAHLLCSLFFVVVNSRAEQR
jgi:hypothetical protein